MNFKLIHRISGFIVFLISSIVLLMTAAPTLSFWDCGEFITSAVTMSVGHPPGAPFFQLVDRIFSLIPFGSDIGFRSNMFSVFSSSLSVLFTYLTGMRLLRIWKGDPKSLGNALGMIVSCATGALILSFSDTFWFNGVETEMYGIGMFFISAVVWIGLEWYAHAGVFDTERSLLMIAYLVGLSIGIHLLSLLAIFFVFVLIYFRDRDPQDVTFKSALIAIGLSVLGFIVVYPGTVKWVPQILSMDGGWVLMLVVVGVLIYLVRTNQRRPQVRMASLATLLIILGYSTYALIIIRADDKPALNENDPHTFARLYKYLNRDQYGSYPLFRGENYDGTKKFFPRRYDRDPDKVEIYQKYSSDMDYFLKVQFGEYFSRYFMWQFVGRAGDKMGAPSVFLSDEGDWSESAGYPNKYYAIPFILGLLGIFYHFKKDWRTGIAAGALFLVLGVGLVVYFNMSAPQVRERDYFYVGSFYVFALWAGLGVYWLFEIVQSKLKNTNVAIAIAGIALIAGPGNMLYVNYPTHDRHYNYVAFDYAYNLLQSCEKNAILFTGGDNDTFPIWYAQYVAGIRRDIRVVNLSLLNTEWYAKQLKNEEPYGALKVKLSLSDDQLDGLEEGMYKKMQALYAQYDGDAKKVAAAIPVIVKIPIDVSSMDLGYMKDVPEIAQALAAGKTRDTLEFARRASRGSFMAAQDSLIVDIVKNNGSERPIYFASSTSPNDHVGLDQYLVIEGLAWRLTPYRIKLSNNRYYSSMNIPVTMRHFMNVRTTPDSNRAFGFMFRELANPKVNLDEASTKMIMTYRYILMGMAQYAVQEKNDRGIAKTVLQQMEKLLPESIHRIDIMFKPDIAMLYSLAGERGKVKEVTDELEKFYMPKIDADPTGRSVGNNGPSPVETMLRVYDLTEQYDKAAKLLEKYQSMTKDNSVQSMIDNYHKKAAEALAPKTDTAARP